MSGTVATFTRRAGVVMSMTANPYEWLFANPELAAWYVAATLVLLTWVFISLRYTFRWYVSFRAGMQRWEGSIPDKKASNELALLAMTWAANLAILGAFLYAVV